METTDVAKKFQAILEFQNTGTQFHLEIPQKYVYVGIEDPPRADRSPRSCVSRDLTKIFRTAMRDSKNIEGLRITKLVSPRGLPFDNIRITRREYEACLNAIGPNCFDTSDY